MPLTKAQFRTRVREQSGDPVRVTGTATGGSVTTIVDTTRLIQADSYWNGLWAFVITTTDSSAPQGEAQKVYSSTNSSNTLTVELPFSAAVGAGDTYGVAVFSNARIDNIIAGVLKEFSDYRPLQFNEDLEVTANEKRFAPTSAAAIRYVSKIEYYDPGVEETEYEFIWNKNTRKVEFKSAFTAARTLTLYAAKAHSLPAADATAMTYDDDDEDRLVRWCVARLMQSLSANEFRDNQGALAPQSWTTGEVSETYGNKYESFLKYNENMVRDIIASFPSIKI